MGISYYACDICGNSFPDVIDYVSCNECYKIFCCEECVEEAKVKYDYYDDDGNKVSEDEEWRDRKCCSCKFCRKEDFDDETLFKEALKLLGISKEELITKLLSEK